MVLGNNYGVDKLYVYDVGLRVHIIFSPSHNLNKQPKPGRGGSHGNHSSISRHREIVLHHIKIYQYPD